MGGSTERSVDVIVALPQVGGAILLDPDSRSHEIEWEDNDSDLQRARGVHT